MRAALLAWMLVGSPLLAQSPSTLGELREIASARYETARTAQLAELEKFQRDLEWDQEGDAYHQGRLREAAGIGDCIVPELLRNLAPYEEGNRRDQAVARNSAAILRLMDPAGFVEELLAVTRSPSPTARLHAIQLLGRTRSPRAAQAIATQLPELRTACLVAAIEALGRLDATDSSATIAPRLSSGDARLRTAAAGYLAATGDPSVLDVVLENLQREQTAELLPQYVAYLRKAAVAHDAAATALLRFVPWVDSERGLVEAITDALAGIAPAGHQGSLDACRYLLGRDETGGLGLRAALTMRALGDDTGVAQLVRTLDGKIRREAKSPVHYENRAEVHRATGSWELAARDYQKAIERTDHRIAKRRLFLLVARCEARREKREAAVLRALRESRASLATITEEAQADPALEAALRAPTVKRYLDELAKGSGDSGR